MKDDKACITGLSLGLGLGMGGYVPNKEKQKVNKPVACLDLTFELYPKGEGIDLNHDKAEEGLSLKRSDEGHQQHPNGKRTDNTSNKNGSKKKLRLTKEQSAILADRFKLDSTLNPAQKHALADQLNLEHRQIEVWFQNRRARTKLKQTEVDCEFLKKCYEKLTDENLRLKKELQELRALKGGPSPLYIQLSKAATLTTCSSCEELLKPSEGNNAAISDEVRNNNHKLQSSIVLEDIRNS